MRYRRTSGVSDNLAALPLLRLEGKGMSKIVITERQQYWLDHVRAADAFNGTLVEYAKVEGLKVSQPCTENYFFRLSPPIV